MNEFTVRLDLAKGKARQQQTVFVRQGDKNATTIVATITDHGAAAATTGLTARFSMRLPDGTHYYRKAASLSGNVATVTLDEAQAASVAGRTDVAYFQLLQGSTVVASTESFTVVVLPDALADAEVAESYDSAIQDAIDALDAAVEQMPDMVEDVLADHPEWTTTVQDGSIGAAKLATDLARDRERLLYRLANMLTNTLPEGDVATATDAAKTPVAGLALYGRSTQDGTPTPSAPVAIQSVEAPNLLDYLTNYTASAVRLEDGKLLNTVTDSKTYATPVIQTYLNGSYTGDVYYIDASNVERAGTYSRMFQAEHAFNQVRIKHNGSSADIVFLTQNVSAGAAGDWYYVTVTFDATNPSVAGGLAVRDIALYAGQHVMPYVPSGDVGIAASGKNVFDQSLFQRHVSANGVTWTLNADGSVSAKGTATAISQTYWALSQEYMARLGGMVLSGSPSASGCLMRVERGSSPYTVYAEDTGSGATITFPSEGAFGGNLVCRVNKGATVDVTFRPMVRPAGTSAEYVPYEGSVTPIPLDGHELRSLPDGTRDEVTVDERGHAVLVQRVGEFTITQDLANAAYSYANLGSVGRAVMLVGTSTTPAAAQVKSDNGLCTAAPWKSSYTENSIHVYVTNSSNASLVAVFAQGSTAVEVASKFVGEQFLYEMATPVTHDLGTIDPVPLCGPDLTAQAVPTAPFALTYERDLNATLARLESAIATLA